MQTKESNIEQEKLEEVKIRKVGRQFKVLSLNEKEPVRDGCSIVFSRSLVVHFVSLLSRIVGQQKKDETKNMIENAESEDVSDMMDGGIILALEENWKKLKQYLFQQEMNQQIELEAKNIRKAAEEASRKKLNVTKK
ncbi:hypothetical protein FQA39_LY01161 [Lamprigera yunnana]|nr:hypothetical protein FQA39_LY01161 [Lamprigera yunnana]